MGEIVMLVERWRDETTGSWRPAGDVPKGVPRRRGRPVGAVSRLCGSIERDYDLYLMLSGYNAAAHEWGRLKHDFERNGPRLVEAPRGLPPDVSREMKKATSGRLSGTLSYVTVREVLAFDWTRYRAANFWPGALDQFLSAARDLDPDDRIFIFLDDDSLY
ncbi:MAG: hypothetical protein QNK04_00495 [Myxococcota bacterium]|nr:hypothetical protein [Myxococcota bacterium]